MNEIQSAVIAAFNQQRSEHAPLPATSAVERSSHAVPGLHIAVSDSLVPVEAAWRRFEPEADGTVFQDFDYLTLWQRHIGIRHAVTPAIVVIRSGAGVLAVLPLAVARSGVLRRLSWLGQDQSDYLAPLLAKDFSRFVPVTRFAPLWREIIELMQSDERFRHDFVEFRNMPEKVGGQSNPFLALAVTRTPSSAHLASLPDDWKKFYDEKRSSGTRRRDRYKRKRLDEMGDVRTVTPDEDVDIRTTIETLVRQKSAALKRMGVADIFAKPGVHDFYFDLATNPRSKSLVHVSRLDVGAIPASVNFGLQYRNRYHYIFVSYDDGEVSRFSPGAAHLRELMARAIEKGFREFDFTIGDEGYKFEWSDTETRLFDFFAASSLRGWPVALLLRSCTIAKRTIKQNPRLWHAFQRARSAAAAWRFPNDRAAKEQSDAQALPSDTKNQ